MKFRRLTVALTLICAGISASSLLTSCGKNKKQATRELESSGYEATPSDFLRAASLGDTKALKILIKQDVDPKTVDSQGRTALHLAAQAGHQKAVTTLLEAGIGIDVTDPEGTTPLMLAATQGRPAMIRFLIKQGAQPAPKDHLNRNALIYAIDANQPASVEELAPFLRSELDTALLYAAAQGKYHVIGALTSFGASVYTRHDGGMTPLMLAAENGHTTTVHALLDSGSNRFAINEHGWTAAQVAAAANHESIAELLNQTPKTEELAINEPADDEGVMWEKTPATTTPQIVKNTPTTPSPQPASHSRSTKQHIPFIAHQTITSQGSTPAQVAQELHMRDYHQKNLPIIVEKVTPQAAQVRMLYGSQKQTSVRQGETIPETSFKIVGIHRKFHDSKLTEGKPADISIVEIEDTRTGKRRQLTTQIPAMAAAPWAVLENSSGTQTYAAQAGQTFQTTNGDTYTITDVRPSQVILTHQKSGQVITLPLGR